MNYFIRKVMVRKDLEEIKILLLKLRLNEYFVDRKNFHFKL